MQNIQHILFPFDFSAQGIQTASFVRVMAQRFHAKVTLLSTIPPVWDVAPLGASMFAGETPTEWTHELQSQLDQALSSELAGVTVERVTTSGDPAIVIVDFAHANGVDLIMMPTHGAGLFRSLLLGSVTAKVLHDATCAVWTATHAEEQRARLMPRSVLCAVDGGSHSSHVLQAAAALSAQLDVALTLLHVVPPVTDWPSLERERSLQDQVRDRARATIESIQQAAGVVAPLRVAVGEIVATVTEEARQEDADVIVIGRGVIGDTLGRLRTHTYGIIRRSPCPVVSV